MEQITNKCHTCKEKAECSILAAAVSSDSIHKHINLIKDDTFITNGDPALQTILDGIDHLVSGDLTIDSLTLEAAFPMFQILNPDFPDLISRQGIYAMGRNRWSMLVILGKIPMPTEDDMTAVINMAIEEANRQAAEEESDNALEEAKQRLNRRGANN